MVVKVVVQRSAIEIDYLRRCVSQIAMATRVRTRHLSCMSSPMYEPQTRPMTIEEFADLPEEDAYKLELVRGWVVREPRPKYGHGRVTAFLVRRLGDFAEQHGLGE